MQALCCPQGCKKQQDCWQVSYYFWHHCLRKPCKATEVLPQLIWKLPPQTLLQDRLHCREVNDFALHLTPEPLTYVQDEHFVFSECAQNHELACLISSVFIQSDCFNTTFPVHCALLLNTCSAAARNSPGWSPTSYCCFSIEDTGMWTPDIAHRIRRKSALLVIK